MKFVAPTAIATLLAATSAIALQPNASAFTVTQTSDATTLKNALLGETPNLSDFNFTFTGDPLAFGTFADDPFGVGNGLVLSTGQVSQIPGVNTISTTPSGGPEGPEINDLSSPLSNNSEDLAQIDITFFANDLAEKVFFSYVFASEEFPEFGGNIFNDVMELQLNGVNLAFLNDGQIVSINSLVPSFTGPFNPDYIDNPAGTGPAANVTRLDGYTKVLNFEGALNKNATNTLSIFIKDVGDKGYDSALFLKGGSISSVPPNPVPEPTTIAGVLLGGSLLTAGKRLRQRAK